jgi:DNA-directed RNA polymerase specialized sigma subunit
MEDLNLIVELEKAIKKAKAGGELPPGGEWKTIRGARVYIVDGKIHAGAGGKLDGMTVAEAQELHDARTNKKSYDGIIHEGTEVKVGRERKTGKAVKVTPDHVHIDYGDGKEARQVRRNEARRADAWKLRMEEKIERANTTTPPILKPENAAKHHAKPNVHGEGLSAKDKAEKQKLDREDLGGNVKDDDEWAEDLVMSEQKAGKFRAPLLRRDAAGNPIKERLYDGIGNPVIDRYTGKHKERFIVEHSDSATEDDVVRDHQGLLISEVVNPLAKNYGLEHMQREWRDENGLPTDLYADLVQTANVGFLHGLREFVAKQSKGDETKVDILTHALTRARHYTKRQAQNIFADVKLPGRMMEPLAVINSVSEAMTQKLGRAPSESELLNGIEGVDGIKGNPTFKSYQMKGTPEFDQATGKFSDGKKLTDPAEKLSAMMQAKRLQHMGRLDKVTNAADSDDKEVTAKDIVKDDKQDTLDAMTAKQEVEDRMKKLRQGVKKLLGGLLDEREAQLIALRFGIGNRKQDGLADLSDVAEKMGLSLPNAKKISAAAMRKLTQADPATLERLKKIYMTKSLSGLDKLLKALFVEDLQKSLESFGLSVEDLEPKILRTDVGTEAELKKSLGITEFIASIVEAEGVPGVFLFCRYLNYDILLLSHIQVL